MRFSGEAAKYLVINAAVWLVVSRMDIVPFTEGSVYDLLFSMSLCFGGPALLVIAFANLSAPRAAWDPLRLWLALGLAVTAMPFLLAISPTPLYVQLIVQGLYLLVARRAWV
ncbi:hypothetical protein [Kitasatospora paranensis]|uniref:Uncharacterized protein n=1 Tax=Kitasatospora paranensis TaxID=258053 RepID=A0ABW2G5A0_9ACTN